MNHLMDMKNVELTVIGESMAGKTTWITSLFSEKVNMELREKCLENMHGQTKIRTSYRLVDSSQEKICVEYIDLSYYELCSCFENNEGLIDIKIPQILEQPLQKLGIIEIVNEAIREHDAKAIEDIIRINLHDMELDVLQLFHSIINVKEIAELRIINNVCISGPAASDVYDIMQSIGLGIDTVTIRDTRGLMDETDIFKKMQEKASDKNDIKTSSDNRQKIITSLLAERGVLGADGCVFFTPGGNALNKEEAIETYRFLFESILDNMPTFLIARSSVLNVLREYKFSNESMTAEKYEKLMTVDSNYSFVDLLKNERSHRYYVELLKEFWQTTDTGLKNEVMKKHYKQMLLPDIMPDVEEERRWYIQNSHAAFACILKEVYTYKKEMYRILEEMKGLPQRIKAAYDDAIDSIYKNSITREIRKDRKWDTRCLKKECVENVAEKCVCSSFFGGLVGVRGGVTTYINGFGIVGKYAVDLLEAAYDVYNEIADKFCNSACIADDYGLSLKQNTYELLKRICNSCVTSYSCTNSMFGTGFLYSAWSSLHKDSQVNKVLSDDSDNAKALEIVKYILQDIVNKVLVSGLDIEQIEKL